MLLAWRTSKVAAVRCWITIDKIIGASVRTVVRFSPAGPCLKPWPGGRMRCLGDMKEAARAGILRE